MFSRTEGNSLGWKALLKTIYSRLDCHGQKHLSPDQVAQNSIQLEHLEGSWQYSYKMALV